MQDQASSSEQKSTDHVAKAGLIKINQLEYKLPPDLSVVVSRTQTSQFFAQNAYLPGSTAVCILNTGSSYIYGPNSYLTFTVTNTSVTSGAAAVAAGFGTGSATNLIRRITITSRSGDVLERVDNLNLLSHIRARYMHDATWFDSTGSLMGYGAKDATAASATKLGPGGVKRVVIPMSEISGLFRHPNLLPSALMSGCRIEIEWESGLQSLIATNADDVPAYSISDIRVECDSYQLTDLILRSLNEMASQTGLEVVFSTYFSTQATRAASSLNIESRKAVSRALGAFMRERTPKLAAAANTDAFLASAITNGAGCTDLQWRAGNLYFPNTSLRNPIPDLNSPELYAMTMRSFGKFQSGTASSVTPTEFNSGHQVFGVDLERSTSQSLAGIPISNSRVLALNASYFGAAAPAKAVDLYLEYVTLARVFLSNTTIEI